MLVWFACNSCCMSPETSFSGLESSMPGFLPSEMFIGAEMFSFMYSCGMLSSPFWLDGIYTLLSKLLNFYLMDWHSSSIFLSLASFYSMTNFRSIFSPSILLYFVYQTVSLCSASSLTLIIARCSSLFSLMSLWFSFLSGSICCSD